MKYYLKIKIDTQLKANIWKEPPQNTGEFHSVCPQMEVRVHFFRNLISKYQFEMWN